MTLHAVLMPVPGGPDLPRNQRRDAQRQTARRAVDESARLSGHQPRPWPQNAARAPVPVDGIFWSLSHKPAWTAGVVADGPVGIDIEAIVPRANQLLFAKVAKPDEWALIGQTDWDNFFRLWTAKEAALKANGLGIGHLGECRLIDAPDPSHVTIHLADRDWPIEQFFHQGHVAAVTAGSHDVAWTVAQPIQ
ncbi:MAG: 4'-phosphopantetheinyl transferase family protein [Phycisphaerae bacterium]